MAKKCMHYFVSGLVQGVWFRASTKEEAMKLGLTGWVRNLNDGRVEVLACGEERALDKLHVWLEQGPPLAKVQKVISEETAWDEHIDFEQR